MTTFVVIILMLSYVVLKIEGVKYSLNVVFIKQTPQSKTGTLYLRVIQNRNQKRVSLGIKLTKAQWTRYFDQSTNLFRENKAYPLYREHNQHIKVEIEKLKSQLHLPEKLHDRPRSFLDFWQRQIELIPKHGTRIKHQVVFNKLKKFLGYRQSKDLPFDQLTPELIEDIQFYFRTAKDPRKLSLNSENQYLKMIKSVIKKAQLKKVYHFSNNPFDTIIYNRVQPKEKTVLGKEELFRIANLSTENMALETAKSIFLFQVFSNGMRIGDVIRLRWGNISDSYLKYEMMKNGKELKFPININLSKLLLTVLGKGDLIDQALYHQEIPIKDRYNFKEGMLKYARTTEQRENFERRYQKEYISVRHYEWKNFVYDRITNQQNEFIKANLKGGKLQLKAALLELQEGGLIEEYKGYYIPINEKELYEIVDILERFDKKAEKKLQDYALQEARNQKNHKFIFNVLSNEDFKNLQDWSMIDEKQYKTIRNKSIVINRRLKIIQKECQIEENLTSHVARHTFSNLLLQMDNVSTLDLSETLGHSSLAITVNYIKSGFNKNKHEEINKRFSRDIRI